MNLYSGKNFSAPSVLISLCVHAGILLIGHAAVAYSWVIPIQTEQSILLELNSSASHPKSSAQKAALPKTEEKPQNPAPEKEKLADAAPKNSGWDNREFQDRQARMDQKIELIREQIRKIKEGQSTGAELKGFELISAGLDSESWRSYLAKLRRQVLEKWYPMILSRESQLKTSEARLDFYIGTDGRVVAYEIADLKGVPVFGEICLEAFRRAIGTEASLARQAVKPVGNFLKVSLFFYYQ